MASWTCTSTGLLLANVGSFGLRFAWQLQAKVCEHMCAVIAGATCVKCFLPYVLAGWIPVFVYLPHLAPCFLPADAQYICHRVNEYIKQITIIFDPFFVK
eukprot:6358763-Karenia_brevis.AAC.1